MQREGRLVNRIRTAILREHPEAIVIKLHGGPYQQAGLPDLLVVIRGRAVFLEVKRPGGALTPLQEHTIARLRAAGALAEVVRSADEALVKLRPFAESLRD